MMRGVCVIAVGVVMSLLAGCGLVSDDEIERARFEAWLDDMWEEFDKIGGKDLVCAQLEIEGLDRFAGIAADEYDDVGFDMDTLKASIWRECNISF